MDAIAAWTLCPFAVRSRSMASKARSSPSVTFAPVRDSERIVS